MLRRSSDTCLAEFSIHVLDQSRETPYAYYQISKISFVGAEKCRVNFPKKEILATAAKSWQKVTWSIHFYFQYPHTFARQMDVFLANCASNSLWGHNLKISFARESFHELCIVPYSVFNHFCSRFSRRTRQFWFFIYSRLKRCD